MAMEASEVADKSKQRIKLALACAVIVICCGWLAYLFLNRERAIEIKPTTAIEQFMAASPAVFADEKFEFVTLEPGEAAIKVVGRVRDETEMTALKAALGAVTPKVDLTWEVKIGR